MQSQISNHQSQIPAARNLVLLGGGHSHALLLRMVAMKPMPGVEITLISDVSQAPYSGMLPGHIAGFYTHDETHIDLRKLCEFAGARFILAEATGLNPSQNEVLLKDRSPIRYHALSINIGSTPGRADIPGAIDHTIPSKPVPELLDAWNQIVTQAETTTSPLRLTLTGAGAGGVELALCMAQRLKDKATVTLIQKGDTLLPGHNPRVRKIFTKLLANRKITTHLGDAVTEVTPTSVLTNSGKTIPSDHTFWVTNAIAPPWIAQAGLNTDDRGFIQVHNTLQSTSHKNIFAAGDIATITTDPRPKSGVFAVRSAKPLLKNLRRFFDNKPLAPFKPQKQFLSLIGTASGSAVASRKILAWESPLMWKLKDHIDRKFMAKFSDLPDMGIEEADRTQDEAPPASLAEERKILQQRATMRCSGCAAKVGSTTLHKVMERITRHQNNTPLPKSPLLIGLDAPDDAAVSEVPPGEVLVQTVDFIPELVSDPWTFGKIAAAHCMSDIFAMGANPHSVLALITAPFAAEDVLEETLFQTMSGLLEALNHMQVPLAGGHTAEGERLALGLTCNGSIKPEHLLRKGGMNNGDSIILTKPLGTGTLFAAAMRLETDPRWIDHAITSMVQTNQLPSQILRQHNATACTDVTGFGLIGHLKEMISGSDHRAATLHLPHIPLYPGAQNTTDNGIFSSLYPQNRRAINVINNPENALDHPAFPLLFDPQTSGGLLATVPQNQAQACLTALKKEAAPDATIIGQVTTTNPTETPIQLTL